MTDIMDEIKKVLLELSISQKESQKETRELKESQKETDKQIKESQKETDRQMKEIQKEI